MDNQDSPRTSLTCCYVGIFLIADDQMTRLLHVIGPLNSQSHSKSQRFGITEHRECWN